MRIFAPHIGEPIFFCVQLSIRPRNTIIRLSPIVDSRGNIDRRPLLNGDRRDLFARLGCDWESQREYVVPIGCPWQVVEDGVEPHRLLYSIIDNQWVGGQKNRTLPSA